MTTSDPVFSKVTEFPATDGELLTRFVRAREEAAFAEIVRKHAPMVWRICRHVLRDTSDAEDAFQATFLILVQKAKRIGEPSSLGSWLYKVAHRTALRAASQRRQRSAPTLTEEPPDMETPLRQIEQRERQLALYEELRRLPERYQAPLVLCYLQGLSRSAAAQELECTTAAVKGRLTRGKRLLRMQLARRGIGLSLALVATVPASAQAAAAPEIMKLIDLTIQQGTAYASSGKAPAGDPARSFTLAREGGNAMFWSSMAKPSIAVATAVVALLWLIGNAPSGTAADSAPELAVNAEAENPPKAERVVQAAEDEATPAIASLPASDSGNSQTSRTTNEPAQPQVPEETKIETNYLELLAKAYERMSEAKKVEAHAMSRSDERERNGLLNESRSIFAEAEALKFEAEAQRAIRRAKLLEKQSTVNKKRNSRNTAVSNPPQGQSLQRISANGMFDLKIKLTPSSSEDRARVTLLNGGFQLPAKYPGTVQLGGLTAREAENVIREHLRQFAPDPQVEVSLEGMPEIPGPSATRANMEYRIQPLEFVKIHVRDALPDFPITGDYIVDPSGVVALGTLYGRLKISGLTLEEAETKIRERLSDYLLEPDVSVSYSEKNLERKPQNVAPVGGVSPAEVDALREEIRDLRGRIGQASAVPVSGEPQEYRIQPLEIINVHASRAAPGFPLAGPQIVDPGGTVTLGGAYGRVKVSGLTFEEAEEVIREQLSQYVTDPDVSVSYSEKNLERPQSSISSVAGEPQEYRIQPLDFVRILALNPIPDFPIMGNYIVDPSGVVALGAPYGRFKISGLTLEEAETKIREQLSELLTDPDVSVSYSEKNLERAQSQVAPSGSGTAQELRALRSEIQRLREQIGTDNTSETTSHSKEANVQQLPTHEHPAPIESTIGAQIQELRREIPHLRHAQSAARRVAELAAKSNQQENGDGESDEQASPKLPERRIHSSESFVLKVAFQEETHSEQFWVQVHPSGEVILGPDYAGEIRVAGLTQQEAEDALLAHFEQYLDDPVVSISLMENPFVSARFSEGPAVIRYRLRPQSVVSLHVPQALPDFPLDAEFTVDWFGNLNLGRPYGKVKVGGLTLNQAENVIRDHLSDLLENPSTTVRYAQGMTNSSGLLGDGILLPSELAALQRELQHLEDQVTRSPSTSHN